MYLAPRAQVRVSYELQEFDAGGSIGGVLAAVGVAW
jgi:hypothetical protein